MKKTAKYLGSLVFCNFYRLLRLFPNNDPVMGCALPFARQYKWWQAMLFPILAMISFDFLTLRLGIWTMGTALTYGFIGLLFFLYFKRKKKIGFKTYASSSILGILLFDFLTGPIMSSIVFRMPFEMAFIGQITFTLMHLASGIILTILIAPVLDPALRPTVRNFLTRHWNKKQLFFERLLRG